MTPAELELRRKGLGGSEIGAVVGLDPYRTPLDIYRSKVEAAPGPEENWRMWWGTQQESFLLTTLAHRPGYFTPDTVAPINIETPGMTWAKSIAWMYATPDGVARTLDGRHVLIECKTANVKRDEGWGPAGSDPVPAHHCAQVLWTLHVLRDVGLKVNEAWVLALFSNREPQRFVVPYVESKALWLVEKASAFWAQVETKSPPVLEAA